MHKSFVLAAVSAMLLACSGGGASSTSTSGSTGGSSGSSGGSSSSGSSGSSGATTGCSSTAVCRAVGDTCSNPGDCCASLSCKGGICTTAVDLAGACAADGEPCTTAADCCGSVAGGTQLACIPNPGGSGSICHLGTFGEACDAATPCGPSLTCIPPSAASSGSGSSGSTASASGSGSGSGSTSAGSDSGSGSGSGSTSAGSDSGSGSGSGSDTGSSGSGSDSGSSGSGSSGGGAPQPIPAVPGTCGFANMRPGGPILCNGSGPASTHTTPCYAGDSCNPNSDFCFTGGKLACDAAQHICMPKFAEALSTSCQSNADCQAAAGEPGLVCNNSNGVFSGVCAEACSTDADCQAAIVLDGANNNPPTISTLCEGTGAGKSCVPALCYDAEAPGDGSGLPGDASLLYQPCTGHPDSRCEPQYWGDYSGVFGFCQAVRPGAASTVGQACANGAGPGLPDLICGADATCLGGVCQPVCDAAPAASTDPNAPKCTAGGTCISSQGVNVTSRNQIGGCGTPCDPFTTDEVASGCTTFCGGPRAICNWIIGDPVLGQPVGYCAAAPSQQLAVDQVCTQDPAACPTGTLCLNTTGRCSQICDAQANGGPDACPAGKTCVAFQGFQHAGTCQ